MIRLLLALIALTIVAAHPALSIGITAAITALIVGAGVVIVARSLRETGWRLGTTTHPLGWKVNAV